MRELRRLTNDSFGNGPVQCTWNPRGQLLAAAGVKRQVLILDRQANMVDSVKLPQEDAQYDARLASTLQLEWDASGEVLAALPRNNASVRIWQATTREAVTVDTGLKSQSVSFIQWAPDAQLLALGTTKGNLMLYNHALRVRLPIVAKHEKGITCGAWLEHQLLALGGGDHMVTITNSSDGTTIKQLPLKGEPVNIQYKTVREELSEMHATAFLSINIAHSALLLVAVLPDDKGVPLSVYRPLELRFQPHYGALLHHAWLGDGYVAVGFECGAFVVVSTHGGELGQEVFAFRGLTLPVAALAVNGPRSQAAVAAGPHVRVLDVGGEYRELRNGAVDVLPGQAVVQVAWSPEGQMVVLTTNDGILLVYLAALPVVAAGWGPRLALMASLQELQVLTIGQHVDHANPLTVSLEIDPTFVAVGPEHVAAGINNQVWVYKTPPLGMGTAGRGGGGGGMVGGVVGTAGLVGTAGVVGIQSMGRRMFLGVVQQLVLNATHMAALIEGRVIIHLLTTTSTPPNNSTKTTSTNMTLDQTQPVAQLPAAPAAPDVCTLGMNDRFAAYGTRAGLVVLVDIHTGTVVTQYRHSSAIKSLWLQSGITVRALLVDATLTPSVYNPVDDSLLNLPEAAHGPEHCVWDAVDGNTFVVAVGQAIHVCSIVSASINGPHVKSLGTTNCPPGTRPTALSNGHLGCLARDGQLTTITLPTHKPLTSNDAPPPTQEALAALLSLSMLDAAQRVCAVARDGGMWAELARVALEHLDVERAIFAFREMGNAGMVLRLEPLVHIEDWHLRAACILTTLEHDPEAAEELMLTSSQPAAAVGLWRDLQEWQRALVLAQQLQPEMVGYLSCRYAEQLELQGNYDAALIHYEASLTAAPPAQLALLTKGPPKGPLSVGNAREEWYAWACHAGKARCAVHEGAVDLAVSLARASQNEELCIQVADLLEMTNHLREAADLYERANAYDKAAAIHIRTKNYTAAAPLIHRIANTRLLTAYARAKEAEGKLLEALEVYESAGDVVSVLRLCLQRLDLMERAVTVTRASKSTEAAHIMAQHCLGRQDVKGALEFLVMAQQRSQAYELAATHGFMQHYAQLLGSTLSVTEHQQIAAFYIDRGEYEQAGVHYQHAGDLGTALQLYLKAGPSAVHCAISLVSANKDPTLVASLQQHLAGRGREGFTRDPTLVLALEVALGNWKQAAEQAWMLAKEQQDAGNYKVAHAQLLEMWKQFEARNKEVPAPLMDRLMLLHSYVLVKPLIAMGDDETAARMLLRVVASLSQFPAHVPQLLTSTVIQCAKAKMKRSALQHAVTLMQPELRGQLAPEHRRKIENLVRKKEDMNEEAVEASSACPWCTSMGPETQLECAACHETIPFCCATGKRVRREDWSRCPSCRFPCRAQPFLVALQACGGCPMCGANVAPSLVHIMAPPGVSSARTAGGGVRGNV